MIFHRVVVIDYEAGIVYRSRGEEYDGPVALAKPKRSPLEGTAQSISSQDQSRSVASQDTAQGTLGQYEGKSPLDTAYGKSLLATTTDSTSNAYENAKAASAAKANAAGFGYESPIGQAASRETTNAEAGALAKVPAEVSAEVAPLQLEAARDTAQIGATQGQQGLGYMTGVATPLEEQYQNQKQAFQNRLWNIGSGGLVGALSPKG